MWLAFLPVQEALRITVRALQWSLKPVSLFTLKLEVVAKHTI